jgi:hypothetical protein
MENVTAGCFANVPEGSTGKEQFPRVLIHPKKIMGTLESRGNIKF